MRLAEVEEKKDGAAHLAEATRLYHIAVELCAGGEVCAYAHHRLGWLAKAEGAYPTAIQETELALWDTKGQVREEVLKDYILFLASAPDDGKKALNLVLPLSQKLTRPALLSDLADAFYSAGNKVAGTYVLAYVNSLSPSLAHQARLLEEYYGLRNWDGFREVLEQTQSAKTVARTPSAEHPVALDAKPAKQDVEAEKILRRLTIQLDGERISQPQYAADFENATLLYLRLFPTSPVRFKMMEGWLAAETSPERKLSQLKIWTSDPSFALSPTEQKRLHEMRAGIAQKNKDYATVAEETTVLADLYSTDTAKAREYRFLKANALLEQKNPTAALPLFKELAKPALQADPWALRSQRSALGILAENKDYAGIIQQADLWLDDASVKASGALSDARKEFTSIREQAAFEQAVQQGKVASALKVFEDFCERKVFLPKSCDNARVLAVQLGDQNSLFAVLKAEGKKEELANEYELSARFASAAELREAALSKKAPQKPENKDFLKVALLYELAENLRPQPRLDRTRRQVKNFRCHQGSSGRRADLRNSFRRGPRGYRFARFEMESALERQARLPARE